LAEEDRRRLKNIKPGEVSLVDAAANEEDFLVVKSEIGGEIVPGEATEEITEKKKVNKQGWYCEGADGEDQATCETNGGVWTEAPAVEASKSTKPESSSEEEVEATKQEATSSEETPTKEPEEVTKETKPEEDLEKGDQFRLTRETIAGLKKVMTSLDKARVSVESIFTAFPGPEYIAKEEGLSSGQAERALATGLKLVSSTLSKAASEMEATLARNSSFSGVKKEDLPASSAEVRQLVTSIESLTHAVRGSLKVEKQADPDVEPEPEDPSSKEENKVSKAETLEETSPETEAPNESSKEKPITRAEVKQIVKEATEETAVTVVQELTKARVPKGQIRKEESTEEVETSKKQDMPTFRSRLHDLNVRTFNVSEG